MTISHSIVIPTRERAGLTRRCIETLLDLPECERAEIIVVDDGSTGDVVELLASHASRVRVVTHQRPLGFAAACNTGTRESGGEAIVLLNNDALPREGWLTALLDHAARHRGAAVIGSRLLYPDGTVQHAGIAFCQDRWPRHLYAGFPGDHPAVTRSRPVRAVTAACALVRRDALERVDGFDEEFRNGMEDVDLCLRLGEAGYEVRYCAESVVEHLERASRGPRSPDIKAGELLYQRRWGGRVEPDDVSYYLADGLIEIRYQPSYPARLRISPLLASIDGDDREREANWLLNARSRQAFDFMREAVRLTGLLADAAPDGSIGTEPRRESLPVSLGGREDLAALLAEAHDELRRRDEELALELHGLQARLAESNNGAGLTPSEPLGYGRLVERVRELVRSTVPTSGTVIVISKGDEELLRLDGRPAWHFPCAPNGEYAGHYPASGAAAIAEIEALRARGAGFLVLPAPSLWWLDHYASFREHLARNYRELAREEETAVVYALDPHADGEDE
jgi:GT2 family glycosyltransferase